MQRFTRVFPGIAALAAALMIGGVGGPILKNSIGSESGASSVAQTESTETPTYFFPPPGESLDQQDQRQASEVGLRPESVTRLRAETPNTRWALWRHGYLVHFEGDWGALTEVKSLRKTWHALTVGAAIRQGKIPSLDQKLSEWTDELTGKDAEATWWHVISQTSGFDYPYDDLPAYGPGEMWTYSDKNPHHLGNALARVYGKRDYSDGYDEVVREAYFDAIGLRGWRTSVRQDGIRFHFDLEDLGRLGLLVLAGGNWDGRQLISPEFVEALETKQTRGALANYHGPDDGDVGLDPAQFPEAPYGFMTWVNTDGNYYGGADRRWALGRGAGGSCVLWNRHFGIVFAGFGIDTLPTGEGIPHVIEAGIAGPNPLARAQAPAADESLDRTGTQWRPYVEWNLSNPGYEGNPFDLDAAVTFTHTESGEQRTTGMFYDGGDSWKFRFTGTRPGEWTFVTTNSAPPLDGRTGTVIVRPNEEDYGFVTHRGNRWSRPKGVDGRLEAIIPQFVMYAGPHELYRNSQQIDADIQTFLVDHGFTGFHVSVACRWFDLEHDRASDIDAVSPNPDPRTFEALEQLITKTHAAGGVVHIWAWGDEQRTHTPIAWGINGEADRRLQRYIAARLGPLPGWTMGYGFDLWEWVNADDLLEWHRHLHEHLGWPHILGARAHRHGRPLEDLMTDRLDYIGFETHRPDYAVYVEALKRHPDKPVFMEDRFRIRDSARYSDKDYDEVMTRHGLWHSAMAGGAANIWGYLHGDSFSESASRPYPNVRALKTYAEFFQGRFLLELDQDNDITDGVCLRTPDRTRYLVYKEDAGSIRLDLSRMAGPQPAVAVDTAKPYQEIDLGSRGANDRVWTAPYQADWAVAVGDFSRELPSR